MSNYAGNPASYPVSIPRVADNTPPDASDLDVPLEALADRSAWLRALTSDVDDRTQLLSVLNFRRATDAGIGVASRPFFNSVSGEWVVPGASAVQYSADQGLSLATYAGIPNISGETCTGGDAASNGNTVIASRSRYVFRLDHSAQSWTRVDWIGATVTLDGTHVVRDEVHGKWVAFAANVNLLVVKHSADGTTWASAVTMPTGDEWTSDDYYLLRVAIKRSTGRIVAILHAPSESSFGVATSDDGGNTWTTRTSISDAGSPTASSSSLVYNEATNVWYFTHGKSGGGRSSRVYKSADDGVTWTLVTTLTSSCLRSIACLGTLLVGVVEMPYASGSSVYRIAYSIDGGATWKDTQFRPGLSDIHQGGNGLMLAGAGFVLTSLRMGIPVPGTVIT